MDIVAIYYILVALAVAGAIGALLLGHRAKALRWPAAILLCFAFGAAWQEVALRTFAAREPDGMSGLILRPVPLGGGDHEFTPHGAHYAKLSFVIPGSSALGLAILVGVAAVIARRGSHGTAAAVSSALLAGTLGYALLALARLIAASEIFI